MYFQSQYTKTTPVGENHLKIVSDPEIIMTVDSNDKMTPVACAIMVVTDIEGPACSCLLKVLFDYGGSLSVCYCQVLPRGAHITQQSLMRTLARV